jgi:hypothetical protein
MTQLEALQKQFDELCDSRFALRSAEELRKYREERTALATILAFPERLTQRPAG